MSELPPSGKDRPGGLSYSAAVVESCIRKREAECSAVARFLHDSIGQNLTALGLRLDVLRMDLEAVSAIPFPRIIEIQQILECMMEDIREYIYAVNPLIAEQTGLRPALERLVTRLQKRFAGRMELHVEPSLQVTPKAATALYQIAQEAAENALQHSGCSTIEITVRAAGTNTYLEVRDDGKGFQPKESVEGFRGLGLLSMEYYAGEAGVELSITGAANRGTIIRAAVRGIA